MFFSKIRKKNHSKLLLYYRSYLTMETLWWAAVLWLLWTRTYFEFTYEHSICLHLYISVYIYLYQFIYWICLSSIYHLFISIYFYLHLFYNYYTSSVYIYFTSIYICFTSVLHIYYRQRDTLLYIESKINEFAKENIASECMYTPSQCSVKN